MMFIAIPYGKTFSSISIMMLGSLFACFLVVFVRAQSIDDNKQKVKDFGLSIKSNKDKNKEQSTKNVEKSKSSDEETDEVIKIETRLVRNNVLVVDQNGKLIRGLRASDFIVTENDVPQEIDTFSLGENVDIPKSIVLIIDYSGSQIPFIKNSVEAAKLLVDKLNPKDRMAIVTDDIELLTGFTDDKKLLKAKLDSLRKKVKWNEGDSFPRSTGSSLQFSALMATLNEMFDESHIRPIIIFQTDGDEAFSISRNEPQEYKNESSYDKLKKKLGINFTIADLFERIGKSRVTIYSVITDYSMLGLSPSERIAKITEIYTERNREMESKYKSLKFALAGPEILRNHTELLLKQQTAMMIVARASGGFTESMETPEQADEIYSRILTDINNRYLISYYPKNPERDGKPRNVKIEVRGHSEFIVWGRKVYFAPEPDNKKH